jgi:hypothetical protein
VQSCTLSFVGAVAIPGGIVAEARRHFSEVYSLPVLSARVSGGISFGPPLRCSLGSDFSSSRHCRLIVIYMIALLIPYVNPLFGGFFIFFHGVLRAVNTEASNTAPMLCVG